MVHEVRHVADAAVDIKPVEIDCRGENCSGTVTLRFDPGARSL